MKFEKYQTNLRVENDYVISYATKVAKIIGRDLIILKWNVEHNNKRITTSGTTTKHINYVANILNLTVVKL